MKYFSHPPQSKNYSVETTAAHPKLSLLRFSFATLNTLFFPNLSRKGRRRNTIQRHLKHECSSGLMKRKVNCTLHSKCLLFISKKMIWCVSPAAFSGNLKLTNTHQTYLLYFCQRSTHRHGPRPLFVTFGQGQQSSLFSHMKHCLTYT